MGGTIERVKKTSKEKSSPIPNVTSKKQQNKRFICCLIGGLTNRPDLVVFTALVGVLLTGGPSCCDGKDDGVVSSF